MSDFVLKRDECVRNDLFVRRIDLSFRTREKEIVSTREERVEIFLWLEVETVKTAKLVEQAAPNDEHVFLSRLLHHCHSERSEAVTQPRKLSGRGQAFNPVAMPIVPPRDVSTSLDMTENQKEYVTHTCGPNRLRLGLGSVCPPLDRCW